MPLSAAEKAVCRNLGLTEREFMRTRAAAGSGPLRISVNQMGSDARRAIDFAANQLAAQTEGMSARDLADLASGQIDDFMQLDNSSSGEAWDLLCKAAGYLANALDSLNVAAIDARRDANTSAPRNPFANS